MVARLPIAPNGGSVMTAPKRIRLRRTKGWQKPDGAIVVSRPTRWGNPYRLASGTRHTLVDAWGHESFCAPGEWRGVAVRRFREDLVDGRLPYSVEDVQEQLAGHDLACWCPLWDNAGNPSPCHADVLLEIANLRREAP